jgi:hypothetical protein
MRNQTMKFMIVLVTLLLACGQPAKTSLKMIEQDHKWVLVDGQNKVQYQVFLYDNGPDYPSEGLYRIVRDGKIGYADTNHVVVIEPKYDCAYPFDNGKAKVSTNCGSTKVGEYSTWTSNDWIYIGKDGRKF